MYFKYLTT